MGCTDGQKIVLKPSRGVTKRYMVLNNKVLMAFGTKGKLFSDCSNFSDITLVVRVIVFSIQYMVVALFPQAARSCQTIPGLAAVNLLVTMDADGANRLREAS